MSFEVGMTGVMCAFITLLICLGFMPGRSAPIEAVNAALAKCEVTHLRTSSQFKDHVLVECKDGSTAIVPFNSAP